MARLLLVLLPLLLISRAAFWTSHPPNFDFANFALGVERFDPSQHQPQPPGYPLVILEAKLFTAAGTPPVTALHLTALAGSAAAVAGAGALGGWMAAVLLAVEPAFWLSGVSSPTRPYLAAGACWLLVACGRVAQGRRGWLWGTAGLLALAGGFRPELPLLFAAPVVLAARQGGIGWGRIAAAAGLTMVASLAWALPVLASFGSPQRLFYNYYHYYLHHASTTSALLGAPAPAWQAMWRNALLWNAPLAAVSLLAWLLGRGRAVVDRLWLARAAAYFVPALFIQLAIHQGADSPDHSLGTIAVLAALAGRLLTAAPSRVVLALGLAGLAAASAVSLRSFAAAQSGVAAELEALRRSLGPNDAVLVLGDAGLSWRTLQWELPRHAVIALPQGWRFLDRRAAPLDPAGIELPPGRLHVVTQRKGALGTLCLAWKCEVSGSGIVAEPRPGVVDLPPFRLIYPTAR